MASHSVASQLTCAPAVVSVPIEPGHSANLAMIVGLLGRSTAAASDAFFMGLGDLPGGSFHRAAFGISGAGSVVSGRGDTVLGIQVSDNHYVLCIIYNTKLG